MKGAILAGGLGTRLRPLTLVTNKHLLPVYNKPMILYPLETLRRSGVLQVMIVCGKEHVGHFINFLGSGKQYGMKLSYAVQDNDVGGIADAVKCTRDFVDNDNVAVILGDNIYENDFRKEVISFDKGAKIFLKRVKDPSRFGVAVFDKSGKKILKIEEKPEKPKSDCIQTGFYLFDKNLFSVVDTLKPSNRGQLELSDATNIYLDRDELGFSFVKGAWLDTGTFEALAEASEWVRKREVPKSKGHKTS